MDESLLKLCVEGINSRLDDIKTELAEVRKSISGHVTTCPHRARIDKNEIAIDKVEVRVGSLEKWRWLVTGAAAAAGGTIGSVLATIAKGGL